MSERGLSVDAEEYLSWLSVEKGRAQLTLEAYRRDLTRYEASLGEIGPPEATAEDIDRFRDRLKSEGLSEASSMRAMSAVRGLHGFLVDEGRAASDPTTDAGGERPGLRLPKALSESQVIALLTGIGGDDAASLRDRALLEFLYGTGARISEAVGLNLGDLGGSAVVLRGKGSKERLVPLAGGADRALGRWLGEGGRSTMQARRRSRDDAEAVFLNARGGRLTRQGAFGIAKARALGRGFSLSPHTLRHSCATHMLAHGADIRVVQELLGHASVTTTQLYTKVEVEQLRAVYERAHPRA